MRLTQSGFKRNNLSPDKLRIDLIPTWVLERMGALYAEGACNFGERNWEQACNKEDYTSFEASFCRHSIQFRNGAKDEDHFARAIFNLTGMEWVRMQQKRVEVSEENCEHEWETIKEVNLSFDDNLIELQICKKCKKGKILKTKI